MCKKQTSVSHSSTESEAISVVAGLRIDLWDLVIPVLHSSKKRSGIEKSIARRDQSSGIKKPIAQWNPKHTHTHQHQHQDEDTQ